MSIKGSILEYLRGDEWIAGGIICRAIGSSTNHKESAVERRLRELENAGMIEKKYMQIEGKGAHFVCYRIVSSFILRDYRPEALQAKMQGKLL